MPEEAILITDTYRNMNERLHASGKYGRWGDKWAEQITRLVNENGFKDVLDYGCGQGSLGKALPFKIREYDPAIEGKTALPQPADLIVCTDVMEHIEPDLLANVLDHLQSLTGQLLFLTISTRAASKFLEDGRNAHLIVEKPEFWRPLLEARFSIQEWQVLDDEILAILRSPASLKNAE